MMKFTSLSLLRLLVCALLTLGFISTAGAAPLEGVWVNTNPDTDSVPKIEIEIDDNDKATLIWWGKTHPKNSRYGPLKWKLYYQAMGDKNPTAPI